jgi:putative hydrolase of the HAD superfamily
MEVIRSVIFDWGGVLIEDPRPALMEYCARALGVSEADYVKAHSTWAADFQNGLIQEDTFWTRICGELNRPKPQRKSLWGEAFRAVYRPKHEMFTMVSALHENGYRTALLSNTEAPAMQFFYELEYDMFDALVFSCAEGTSKPDIRLYETTVSRLATAPEQAVFIDDKPEFIDGARRLGINTVLFQGPQQAKDDLAKFGVNISASKRGLYR